MPVRNGSLEFDRFSPSLFFLLDGLLTEDVCFLAENNKY
jgi:hypothetical protein